MLSRLRWDLSDEAVPSRDRATMARIFIYLYGLGATLVLVSLPLSDLAGRWIPGIAGSALAAYAVTALLLVGFDRLPVWIFYALPPIGTLLISVILVSAGAGGSVAYATLYFWVVLSASSFFSARVNVLNLTGVAVAYAVVLEVTPGVSEVGLRWLMVLGTLAVVAVVIEALRGRAERLVERLRHRALHDPLTGRPNATLFTERLDRALAVAHRREEMLAVVFLDIDDFKLINDGFGHGAGDELLKEFGLRLEQALAGCDTVARFGGDEFAILCERVDGQSQAMELADRLRRALAHPFEIEGSPYRVSASAGVAVSAGAEGSEELIANADAAMYLAKERSRGGCEFFDKELRERVRMRLGFESALRAAPDSDQLHIVVQPIVGLPGGRPVGSEVLLRWRHPDLGPIPPSEFIPTAEATGAILPIGEWVLAESCALAARWRADPAYRRYLPLHVNISARQLAQHDFVDQVKRELDASGARVRDLAFEITEHALLGDANGTVEVLDGLQALGFPVVLDDFGTGYSSLSHLKQFPIDTLKIDRGFISNLMSEPKDDAIVSAVIGMADAFALDVVAEGIETPNQAHRLSEIGCRFGQGFHFARPARPDQLPPTLKDSEALPRQEEAVPVPRVGAGDPIRFGLAEEGTAL